MVKINNSNIPVLLLKDIRADIDSYSSEDLLLYYRSACMLLDHSTADNDGKHIQTICSLIRRRVDSVLATMRCGTSYKTTIMANILELEYCKEQRDTNSKILIADVSKATYYKYLKEGKLIFTSLVDQLKA